MVNRGKPGTGAAIADSGKAARLLRAATITLVRDAGFWSPQLELDLDAVGYYSLILLPLGHNASEAALQMGAGRGAMKALPGKLSHVRAARMRAPTRANRIPRWDAAPRLGAVAPSGLRGWVDLDCHRGEQRRGERHYRM